ncbi:hypothetical protein LZA78_01275 [Sinirhodobacter sp. WL0062]|uniref:Uncharacterized protein n=1 Tax=Rhodobacter flavimaris TaxID=2907145 RepID=A0ABS8YUD8_9RHOB|nr:hypothetical protein [Sinirhodobacter sp. WL0062]MCE5972122.1 hypothetical protein [Sinirhodobacter sp. WL0062]
MNIRLALPLAAALTAPLPLAAQETEGPPAMPFTYEMFEASVPHVDIAVCPVDLAAEGRFCRVALFNDAFNIFIFSEEGEQPLVGFHSYDAELMTGLFD